MTPQPALYITDAADAAVWRTAENGKKFQIDTETGEIVKGNVGQENLHREFRSLEATRPDTEHYNALLREHGGNHFEAAKEFFRTRLQGTTMSATAEQGQVEVHFTGGTWKEIKRGIKSDPLKAEMVPHMPDIIATGQYRKRELHKKREDKTVAFHEYRKTIQTSQGPREVIVDVAERESAEPRFNIYNLTREGGQGYAKRVSHDEKENDVISVSSGSSLIMRDNAASFSKNIEPFFEVVNLRFAEEGQKTDRPQTGISDKNNHAMTFDASPSARRIDENGYLHVGASHITKATVNPYYGREIPGWEEAGLEPDKVYYGLRAPEELEKSLSTWSGLPLHIEHHIDSASEPQKWTRVGAVGTRIVWNPPYVDAPLVVWDASAIGGIEDGSYRELSCAYRYEPDFTPGEFEGRAYDFVMRDIRGNHVALVEEGRAGPDVLVADANSVAVSDETARGDAAWKEAEHPRDESGRFGNGSGDGRSESDNPASGKEISITGNELGSCRDIKELRQKAVDYYKANLQGKPAYRDDIGEIRFSRKGLEETKSFSVDPDKLLMFPALRDIIEIGKLGKEEQLNHPRKDGIIAFIPVTKTVNFKGKPKEVEVLLGKDRKGHLYYDLFLDNGRKKSPASGVGHNLRLAGDTAGISPAIDLNIVFISPHVNTDSAAKAKEHRKGAFMGKLKKWFRGAQDDDPGVEQQEVDLAQAIIDLHRLDPATGKIVDVTEDEDKNAAIRKLIDELAGKLGPEDTKRLTDALADLAYSKATGDAEPDGSASPGLDEDNDEQKSFAEGVKYGEKLERTPEEREKLDREHESEGLKRAMDACGLDSEDPNEARAFAEGVKYGEEKGKATAADEPVGDEEPADKSRPAEDRALRRGASSGRGFGAMDAALIRAKAVDDAKNHMRDLYDATRLVRPLVGELDALAFDSASDVYGYALEQSGINVRNYPRSAWRGMVDVLRKQKRVDVGLPAVRPGAPADLSGPFAGLSRINIAQ